MGLGWYPTRSSLSCAVAVPAVSEMPTAPATIQVLTVDVLNHFIAISHLVDSVFLVALHAISARRRQIFTPRMTYFCPNSLSTNGGTRCITAVWLIRFHCSPIVLAYCAMTPVMLGVFWPSRFSA